MFGTIAADVLHKIVGMSYAVTATVYAIAVSFLLWFRTEGTLSVHSITTTRRELFYWARVLSSFALGTAVGDLVGLTLHLGFLRAGLLFAALIVVPLVAWQLGANAVLAFWSAYVLTRPLGASFADWIGRPLASGEAWGFGDGRISLVLIALIVLAVGGLARRGTDGQRPPSAPDPLPDATAPLPSHRS